PPAARAAPQLRRLSLHDALPIFDVLGLLARELEQGAGPRVVREEHRPHVVEDEGQDELLDQPEDAQVGVAANLVERAGLRRRQEDRKSTRLNSSHVKTSYAVCCL